LEITVELSGIAKKYGAVNALRNISMALEKGTVTAISGHNGSGKSTLLKLVSLQSKPTSGNLRLFGDNEPGAEIRRKIGYLAHECFLYGELTVLENLNFYRSMFLEEESTPSSLHEEAESLNITKWLHSKVKNLSHGSKKRVDITRALLHRPNLLVLDEPFSGLDDQAAKLLIEYLAKGHSDRTVLLSSQDLTLIQTFCNAALLLQEGRIVKRLDYR
jgi:ABC-type multidrug transport system ATPase subunit